MTTPDRQVDILLVDDNPDNLRALETILEPLGQHLVRAQSGEDALLWLADHDVAVILLAVEMPGMNGFKTARMIKARERTKFIPIIFLTAASQADEYLFHGDSVGAVDYIFKPFQPELLRSKVEVFVELYQQHRRITEQEQRLREAERKELELRHMREMVQSEARFREIVSTAMDAIISFDEAGSITLVNRAAEKMFGATAAEVLGTSIERFFPESGTLERVLAECSPTHPQPLTARRSSGLSFPIEVSLACLSTPTGRAYTLIVRDVSDRVAHEEALKRQAQSLAESSRELKKLNEELHHRQLALEHAMAARSRFYSSMSHELRTPINAVLGYSTLLLERVYGPLNEKQADGVERSQKAARHLLELVNDALDLSKIESGKIDLRLQPVEFPALVEDLFVSVRPLAEERGSTLSLEVVGDTPIRVISDPRRVRQILLNLLSNAVKFGNGKPVEVVCRALDDGGMTVAVHDHGDGISPEDQERIFLEFVQLGKSPLQGTGLGLPVSRQLAELLRGTLTVESTPGEGSVFCLRLPASAEARPSRAPEQEVTREKANERAISSKRASSNVRKPTVPSRTR